MKTITVSDETAAFLSELATRLTNQDRRGTADPYYFTVRKFVDVAVPEGCGEKVMYFDSQDCESYTEEEAKENAIEHEMEFDDYVEERCNKYDVKEEERYENFFFTLEGYQQHVKMNGHNISRGCNKYDSYVDHAYRNPEIEGVLKAIKEIGCALRQVETGEHLTTAQACQPQKTRPARIEQALYKMPVFSGGYMGGKVRFVYDQDNDWLVDNQSGDVLCQFWNKFEVPFKDHIYWGSVVAAALNNLDKNGHFVQQTSGGAKPKLPKR